MPGAGHSKSAAAMPPGKTGFQVVNTAMIGQACPLKNLPARIFSGFLRGVCNLSLGCRDPCAFGTGLSCKDDESSM